MTNKQKPESAEETAMRWVSDRKPGEAPTFKRFIETEHHRKTAAELISEGEHNPESAEFRTGEDQIAALASIFPELPLAALYWAGRHVAEAEARGAANALAEQRRKDAEGAEPVCYTAQEELDRIKDGKSADIYPSPRLQWVKEDYWPISLYTRPANVAALEARMAELEDAAENLFIALGMGWDLGGVTERLRVSLLRGSRT